MAIRDVIYSDCYSCSKCIHYGDCVDSDDDYNFNCDDLNWTYIYASEDDKEIKKMDNLDISKDLYS